MNFNFVKFLNRISLWVLSYTVIGSFVCAFFLSLFVMYKLKEAPEKAPFTPGDFVIQRESLFSDDDFKKIIERNIFNLKGELPKEDIEKKDKAIKKDEIKKTDLPLKLLGTVYSGKPSSGVAVVEQLKEKKIETFLVGDILIGNAKLYEIYPNKIIIDRGDYKEFLEIAALEIKKSSRNIVKAKAKKASGYALKSPPNEYKEEGFERVGNNIRLSEGFKQKLLSTDFAKILQDVKAVPHFENNELRGYRMTKLKEGSIYQKMGLQANDIIQEINGFVLDDASQVLGYLQSLRSEKDFEIEVSRSGKTQVINVQVQ